METISISVETRSVVLALLLWRLKEVNQVLEVLPIDSPFYGENILTRTRLETALSELGYEQNLD